MSYRQDVRVSRETIHRIRLSWIGTTFVDVGFYPTDRGTTNGSLSIHGDFGPFEHFWDSTGAARFSDFLSGLRYDYAMGKLMMGQGREPYREMERAEPYFWDEVWPVIVEEIRKLEDDMGDWETKP